MDRKVDFLSLRCLRDAIVAIEGMGVLSGEQGLEVFVHYDG